jgi:hypothetical protein
MTMAERRVAGMNEMDTTDSFLNPKMGVLHD